MSRELAYLSLSLLFHDPPWKAWVVAQHFSQLSEKKMRDALKNYSKNGEWAEKVLKKYESLVKEDMRSHEKQAILVPLGIWAALEPKNKGLASIFLSVAEFLSTGKDSFCQEHSSHACRSFIKEADIIASSIDRHELAKHLDRAGKAAGIRTLSTVYYGNDDCSSGGTCFKYVNPFTLDDYIEIPINIRIDLIVEFLELYSKLVADALISICDRQDKDDDESCVVKALNVAYLLMEPTWYYATSRDGTMYIPLADTRIQTHTIFDHLNAALSVLLLLMDGCIVAVDQAGVQGWINESRRLRDLWAASWLASFLSWKSIERLVEKYGPGVMVSPPGRLNPFMATKILGKWLENKKEKDWIWAALGMTGESGARWPRDPVLPVSLIVAVPGEACKKQRQSYKAVHVNGGECPGLEETIVGSVHDAWSRIIGQIADSVVALLRVLDVDDSNSDAKVYLEVAKRKDVWDLVKKLEPPLSVRVVCKRVEKGKGKSDREDFIMFYDNLLNDLKREVEKYKISSPGRRTGRNYHYLAKKLYELYYKKYADSKISIRHCTVCGKALAVLPMSRFKQASITMKEIEQEKLSPYFVRGEIGSEDLCPYCLVKRLLRLSLVVHSHTWKELLGIRPSRSIRWRSVWDHSTRVRYLISLINNRENKEFRAFLTGVLQQLGLDKSVTPNRLNKLMDSLEEIRLSLGGPPVQPSVPKGLEELICGNDKTKNNNKCYIARLLWTIVLESLDSVGSPRLNEIDKNLSSEAAEAFNIIYHELLESLVDPKGSWKVLSVPRRYAIIKADGDFMGKGLLSGRIPSRRKSYGSNGKIKILAMKAGEYFQPGKTLAKPELYKNAVLESYRLLAESIEEKLKEKEKDDCSEKCNVEGDEDITGYTLPVTPSYHMTVSRSLALLSMIDRKLIDRIGGEVIYLGGDDALAIAPPVDFTTESSDNKRGGTSINMRYSALMIATALRRHWRGYTSASVRTGFLVLRHNDGRVLHVSPAPGAYGRTASLLLADAKAPMWTSMSIVGVLEEAKDKSKIMEGNEAVWSKDLLVIASDTRGAIVLPFSVQPWRYRDGWPLNAIKQIYGHIYLGEKGIWLSMGSLHELPVRAGREAYTAFRNGLYNEYVKILAEALSRWIDYNENSLDKNIIKQIKGNGNKEEKKIRRKDIAMWLINSLGGMFIEDNSHNRVSVSLQADKLQVNGVKYYHNRYTYHYIRTPMKSKDSSNEIAIPLLLAIFGAAYVYQSGTANPYNTK